MGALVLFHYARPLTVSGSKEKPDQSTGDVPRGKTFNYSKVERFLSQPFFVAGIFTGTPGKLVDLATTIADFYEVLSGNCDDIPEAAFYMVGGLADVKEKAASLAAATAK